MKTSRIITALAAGLLLVGVAFALGQRGPQTTQGQPHSSYGMTGQMMSNQQSMTGQMMSNQQSMMGQNTMDHQWMVQMHQKLREQWKTMDSELDKLVAEMNAAPEGKKLDAIAAVINKLVEQRKTTHGMMSDMQMQMMQRTNGTKGMQGIMRSGSMNGSASGIMNNRQMRMQSGKCPMAGGSSAAPSAGERQDSQTF